MYPNPLLRDFSGSWATLKQIQHMIHFVVVYTVRVQPHIIQGFRVVTTGRNIFGDLVYDKEF